MREEEAGGGEGNYKGHEKPFGGAGYAHYFYCVHECIHMSKLEMFVFIACQLYLEKLFKKSWGEVLTKWRVSI